MPPGEHAGNLVILLVSWLGAAAAFSEERVIAASGNPILLANVLHEDITAAAAAEDPIHLGRIKKWGKDGDQSAAASMWAGLEQQDDAILTAVKEHGEELDMEDVMRLQDKQEKDLEEHLKGRGGERTAAVEKHDNGDGEEAGVGEEMMSLKDAWSGLVGVEGAGDGPPPPLYEPYSTTDKTRDTSRGMAGHHSLN
ncbi:unnamed protein product [Vitrella brassicaformis CCMP3155]|uniref:Uncharacterized protein n=1 Tax=Vitrella brassicaformis (strain CCMP3155) TaxID=1169540 RepID=A0A0G4H6T5_VITBC|nr:unnamed protein product [Vitrella brassicaformis CCMP3155]|eukprot:CEM39554.1 unnamed protein product [Vitrella brassicaformis CCMP3155]